MLRLLLFTLLAATLGGCMKWDYGEPEDFMSPGRGLFILCEGNFQYSNASLSFYQPDSSKVRNEVFFRANGFKLGDVAQSMTIYNGRGWIVVNNSHVIFEIDPDTFRETGRIENLTSPRYIYFISPRKAYVTQLWDNRIFIIDPSTYSITGHITVPGMTMEQGSTEQMVQYGKYVFCNCWSYQNRIIKIDTETDAVVEQLTVGLQPANLVLDRYGKLWTLTDGGYEGNPLGNESPSLYRIDAATLTIEKQIQFRRNDTPRSLTLNGSRDTLYWINRDVWRMGVNDSRPPVRPFISERNTTYYNMTIDPERGDVYVADAIDYQQSGMIYRFTSQALPIDSFYVGVTPGAFCWK